MTYNSYTDLEMKIVQWAEARRIVQNSNIQAQGRKTLEEAGEIQEATANLKLIERIAKENPDIALRPSFISLRQECEAALRDAYGDVLVTLIVGAATHDVPLVDCLAGAFNEIKDRKGTLLPNGKFQKE